MKTLSLLEENFVRMDLQNTKLDVMQKIMGVSTPSLLEKINDILDNEMVVAYTVDGKPLTKAMYNERLDLAEKQLQSGEYITQEDLEKEAENW
jgi:division protein CdvB (Snf7/Vps24/ESCRT-III family)